MNLIHELVHVPMVMLWSQLAQLSGCNVIFGSARCKMCFQMCNIKLVPCAHYSSSPHIMTRQNYIPSQTISHGPNQKYCSVSVHVTRIKTQIVSLSQLVTCHMAICLLVRTSQALDEYVLAVGHQQGELVVGCLDGKLEIERLDELTRNHADKILGNVKPSHLEHALP